MQFALILAAVATVVLATSPKSSANKIIASILGFLWLWAGVGYHLLFFTKISPPAYLFGAMFVLQGVLFLYEGMARNRLSFRVGRNFDGVVGAIFIVYTLVIYPLSGYALGRTFPASPTFGILLWTDKKFPSSLLIIPVLWSLVGTSAALRFGIREDFGLPVAAMLGTALIIWRDLTPKRKNLYEQKTFAKSAKHSCRNSDSRRNRHTRRRICFGNSSLASALGCNR